MEARGVVLGLALALGDDDKGVEYGGECSSVRASTSGDMDSSTSCFSNAARPPKRKLRLSKTQSTLLDRTFNSHTTLTSMQKQQLARELKLTPRQVEVWFQNRRARSKLKQTEVDCELLKKLYETLREENRRLHRELQELKDNLSLKLCSSCRQTQTRQPFLSLSLPLPLPHPSTMFT